MMVPPETLCPFCHVIHRPVRTRYERFWCADGIAERYERLDDELVLAGEIAPLVADMVPGLGVDAMIRRFVSTAKRGAFGFRPGKRVADLIDLDSRFAPGQYPLRPSIFTVGMAPRLMRARRSVWVNWIREQGWPVPPGLADSILIEHEPSSAPDSPAPRFPNPETRRLVHDAAKILLKSGVVPKRRGSHKLLAEKLEAQFPDYSIETLIRYSSDAHAEWQQTK